MIAHFWWYSITKISRSFDVMHDDSESSRYLFGFTCPPSFWLNSNFFHLWGLFDLGGSTIHNKPTSTFIKTKHKHRTLTIANNTFIHTKKVWWIIVTQQMGLKIGFGQAEELERDSFYFDSFVSHTEDVVNLMYVLGKCWWRLNVRVQIVVRAKGNI